MKCDQDCFNCRFDDCMAVSGTSAELKVLNDDVEKNTADYIRRLKMRENARKWRESERGKAVRAKYEAEHKEQKRAYDKMYYQTVRKKRMANESEEKKKEAKEKKRIYDKARYNMQKMACLQ